MHGSTKLKLPEDGLIRPKHVRVLVNLTYFNNECFKVYFGAKSCFFKIYSTFMFRVMECYRCRHEFSSNIFCLSAKTHDTLSNKIHCLEIRIWTLSVSCGFCLVSRVTGCWYSRLRLQLRVIWVACTVVSTVVDWWGCWCCNVSLNDSLLLPVYISYRTYRWPNTS